jgi:hypothetical protein
VRREWRRLLSTARLVERPRHLHPIVHQGMEFSDVLSSAGLDCWLCGWWQSERYFSEVADAIRRELVLQRATADTRRVEARLRHRAFPVAVHVRRGDYAAVASTRAFHGLCSEDYYRAAMAAVRVERPDATFVFFSDEPEWVASTFHPADDDLMTVNVPDRPEEDLHLMTCCRAHIIANSTFSWWGAWLANTALVIAPRRWFQAEGVDGSAVVPERWRRL